MVYKRVHSSANRATGVENVIDEDDRLAGDIEGNVRLLKYGLLSNQGEIVTIQGDV